MIGFVILINLVLPIQGLGVCVPPNSYKVPVLPNVLVVQDKLQFTTNKDQSLWITQESKDPLNRRMELLNFQKYIINEPTYAFTDQHPDKKYLLPNSPVSNMIWNSFVNPEIWDITFDFDVFRQASIMNSITKPCDTLDDLTNLYNLTGIKSHMPYPPVLIDWKSDTAFGQDQLTFNGFNLRKEVKNELSLSDDVVRKITGSSFNDLLANGRVFKSDFSNMDKYSKTGSQYVPGAYAQFYIDDCKNFMPLAIYLPRNKLTYTPLDDSNHWLLAKLAFNTAESNFQPMNHFLLQHLIVRSIRVEMIRHIGVKHPVYVILNHHFKSVLGLAVNARDTLVNDDTFYDKTFGTGANGALGLEAELTKNYHFVEQKIREGYQMRGLMDIPNHKQRDDILLIRKAIEIFITNYLSAFYKTADDVRKDQELQFWVQSVANPKYGNINGFPDYISDIPTLVDLVTDLITLVTVQHHQENSHNVWNGGVLPAKPKAFFKPLPTNKMDPINVRDYLVSDVKMLAIETALMANFYYKVVPKQLIGASYDDLDLGNSAIQAVKLFQGHLEFISDYINQREANSRRPYKSADPKILAYYGKV
ncbi:lipoxygenase [Globomyces pollinis-pini]|nr:lipoxygenase [Globomyces pollinis-pini]